MGSLKSRSQYNLFDWVRAVMVLADIRVMDHIRQISFITGGLTTQG